MCIETYKNQDAKAVYRRFRDMGRQLPEGLSFVGSWVTADEILPVVPGKDVAGALTPQL